jgi:AraC-like DNA-binding protein
MPPQIVHPQAHVEGLHPAHGQQLAQTQRVRCGQRVLADRLFEVVLIQLLRWLVDHPREAGVGGGLVAALADPRLARALSALHAQPGQAWTLEQMAAQAGMSRSAFALAFREQVGSTPAAYLAQWRIALAQACLRAGEPVKLIAHTLGYANASALSRAFTQVAGCSPRAWLAQTQPASSR